MNAEPRFTYRVSAADAGPARFLRELGGFLATGAALAVGAVLAVFAAAAVTLIALVSGLLLALASLAARARRPHFAHGPVLQARKVGHAWVAYGWDRAAR